MSYSQYSGNPYGSGQEQHEMQQYPNNQQNNAANPYGAVPAAAPNVLSQQDFLSRVSRVRDEIRSLADDVHRISTFHQQALGGADGAAQRHLDDAVASTQLKNTSIRDQLRSLKQDAERTPLGASSAALKKRQWEVLNAEFQKELQSFLQEEQAYRERYREQIARQYRIVNPEATEDEVQRASEMDWGNEGVFQTALRSNRTGQASAVLGNVRARHNELLNIERSITELATLIQDLDTLIIQQEPLVERVEQQTDNAVDHMEEGNKQIDEATKKARSRRKLKWICLGIVILIVLGIALGVGLGVGLVQRATGKSSGGSSGGGNATKVRRALEDLMAPNEQFHRTLELLATPDQ